MGEAAQTFQREWIGRRVAQLLRKIGTALLERGDDAV
jgi:hypothetical protein